MAKLKHQYKDYVEHPRYGRSPRFTGVNPDPKGDGVHLGHGGISEQDFRAKWEWIMPAFSEDWFRTHLGMRIPDTAVIANLHDQTPATVPVTHYFDIDKKCVDCGRNYIFFADEQKHWYEELGFKLDADSIRCVECRKEQRGLTLKQREFEALCEISNRTVEQNFEMAEACLKLIEVGVFTWKATERVRMLLNLIGHYADFDKDRFDAIKQRLKRLDDKLSSPHSPPGPPSEGGG